MSSNGWKKYSLGDIVNIKHGFAFKGEFFSDIPTDDLLLTPGNFRIGGGFKGEKFKYYNGEYPEEYILKADDVIVTMTDLSKEGDTLGYSALVPESTSKRFLHNQRLGLLQFKRDDFDKHFIYWLLRTKPYQTFIVNSASGSTVKHTSPSRIQEYEFEAPPLPTQRRIADILSALDEKIELNRQTNATLEALAQSIFREWFVAFNFPDATGEMVESELGMIPKGWRAVNLGDVTDLTWGDTKTTKKSYIDEGFPAYSASGQDGYLPYYDFDRTGIVVSAIGAYAGKTWLALGKWSCIKNTIRFWSTEENVSNEFLYLYTRAENFWTLRGSAQPFISQTDSRNTKILHPSNGLAKQFGEIVRPLFEQIEHNDNENKHLSEIRDVLLPKLMNGEIDV